jgi:hypothetical protein
LSGDVACAASIFEKGALVGGGSGGDEVVSDRSGIVAKSRRDQAVCAQRSLSSMHARA